MLAGWSHCVFRLILFYPVFFLFVGDFFRHLTLWYLIINKKSLFFFFFFFEKKKSLICEVYIYDKIYWGGLVGVEYLSPPPHLVGKVEMGRARNCPLFPVENVERRESERESF